MSLNPLASAFLPHYQSSSDPPIALCNSTTMSLPLAQLFCGKPSQNIPAHALSLNQHITDGAFLQPTNQSKPDATFHQPTLRSSALLSSPLQNQANSLQANHKTIQQFNQHLKAEHLDRQALQLLVLQLQHDFALLRYLLFSPVETISNKDIAVINSTTSLLINPNPNSNLTLTLLHLLSHSAALMTQNFFGLPRLRLWDTPECKQTFPQMPISSRHPTRRKLLQPRRRIWHQESQNSKNYLQMK